MAQIPLLLSLIGALTLTACGGNDEAPAPEELRAQDSRKFTVDASKLPFAALANTPEADQWSGALEGAGYRIEVPKNSNGMLVMYAQHQRHLEP